MAEVPQDVITSPYKSKMFDKELEIRDDSFAAITAASADRQTFAWEGPFVNPSVVPLDLGNGRFTGKVILNITDLDIADDDEEYTFVLMGHNDAEDESVVLGSLILGANEISPASEDAVPGIFELHFSNDAQEKVWPKLTLGVLVFGTTPSLQFTAFVARHDF